MGIGPFELVIMFVVFVVLFGPGAVLVWWLLTHGKAAGDVAEGQAASDTPAGDPAYEAARERYARGEINRDEYEEIKSTLGY